VEISDSTRNYELCVRVVNKSNIQSKTPSRVTQNRDNIILHQYHPQWRTSMQPESVWLAARKLEYHHIMCIQSVMMVYVFTFVSTTSMNWNIISFCVYCIFVNIVFYLHSEWKQWSHNNSSDISTESFAHWQLNILYNYFLLWVIFLR
jgi:hypothetical protein